MRKLGIGFIEAFIEQDPELEFTVECFVNEKQNRELNGVIQQVVDERFYTIQQQLAVIKDEKNSDKQALLEQILELKEQNTRLNALIQEEWEQKQQLQEQVTAVSQSIAYKLSRFLQKVFCR